MDYFVRKLDEKRRLTIPKELRAEFASGVVITRGFQNYLHLYPKTVWVEDVEMLLKEDILDEHLGDLNVQLRMGKVETVADGKQGRITFEQQLLDYAAIGNQILAVRAGKYWRLMASA